MHQFQLRKPILAALGVCAALCAAPGLVLADDAQDIQTLKDQVKSLQQQINQMSGTKPAGSSSAASSPRSTPSSTPSSTLTFAGVTLYGTVDLGVAYVSHGAPLSQTWGPGLPYFVQSFSNHSITGVSGNGLSQSKVGLSGVEPLVGDFTGIFRLETGFNPWSGRLTDGPGSLVVNDGKAAAVRTSAGDSSRAGQALNGAAYVGVSSKTFGTLTIGRQNGLMLDLLSKYDPQLQAQAFSPISLSGTSGGLGDTQSNRLDNSIKYQVNIGPARAAYIHQFGTDGYIPEGGNEVTLGVDLGGFSMDVLYGLIHGEIAATQLSAAQQAAAPNTLAATVSDNTGYSAQASYNFKEFLPFKLYAGYERIKYNNPEHPIVANAATFNYVTDIGGYLLSVTTNNAYGSNSFGTNDFLQKILQIEWAGLRYSITPKFDLTGAYYQYNQKSFNTNACRNATLASCAGELHDFSLVADYHWTKRFDTYAGEQYSFVQNGLAAGYLYTSDWTTMLGMRFNF